MSKDAGPGARGPGAAGTRPGQATLAGWLIIGGSVAVVAMAWNRIASLHTLEVQEDLRRTLGQPPYDGMSLSVDALAEVIRVLSTVGAAAATAAAILGVYVLRRSTSARLALTVLAPVVLVGGFAVGGFFPPMVVAGIVLLWLRPTRDWIAGRPWAPSAAQRGGRRPDPFAPQDREAEREPVPVPGPGQPSAEAEHGPTTVPPAVPPPAWGPRPAESPYGSPVAPPGAQGDRRPSALVWACTLVWTFCSLVAGGLLLTALVLSVARDTLFAELERQQGPIEELGVTESDIVLGTYVTAAVVVPWCVAAIVLAVLAFRGVGWARVALAVCSGLAAVAALAFALFSPVLVVLVAAASTTGFMLVRGDVTGWFRSRTPR